MTQVWEHNGLYSVLHPIVVYATRCHYCNHIELRNSHLLPTEGSIVFTPNHQSGMMDALTVLRLAGDKLVIFCRGDIFKPPAMRRLLHFLRCLPIYRPRDGREALKANSATLEAAHQSLLHGVPVYITPEGTHHDGLHLLPLRKGFADMACRAQAELADKPVWVVPVAITYSSYSAPYSAAVATFGHPIDARRYATLYAAEPMQAIADMTAELRTNLETAIGQPPQVRPRWGLIAAIAAAAAGLAATGHAGVLLVLLLANPVALVPTTWLSRRLTDDPQFVQTIDFGLRAAAMIVWLLAHFVFMAACGYWMGAVASTFIGVALPWLIGLIFSTKDKNTRKTL
ncbi:MAG: 1-acyl-sn-glycerol-3-phosphate acyltransferase [Bacteroidales bacterium]|nr:1-acyl-sn-glycerol-3-phosphate acyltransferase [Bacteroidales bacterium]